MKEDVHVDLTELPAWQMAVAVRDRQVRAIDLLEARGLELLPSSS